ncbi:MAG: tRNA epoxyqueuosine(34) reductase QueG [Gammaproteobacteria bacterium RIFCSPHIGHO2_12_FULL_35_23]|nr:MAG: tRNA epoxyqueuosine(34) reductase QueG [Gammaproteobacteria bacterium RIFCSPHIGHO2_12_FULL_35_23]
MSQTAINYQQLAIDIKQWAKDLGFNQVGIADINLQEHEKHLQNWLAKGFHGEMNYMVKHGPLRSRPAELLPGTLRVICVALNYLPANSKFVAALRNTKKAYISRYAVGRDYHKVLKIKLHQLATKIKNVVTTTNYRVYVDSAPVLEKALAEKAGLGWIGKHTNLLATTGSSWFFLGELFTDLPLPVDKPVKSRCGSCQACLAICPTQALLSPKQIDARRCISYLTIELKGSIPETLRPLIGNRVYGCDDCQLVCPWNKFINSSQENDFKPRNNFDNIELLTLFSWTQAEFYKKTEGSAIRRIGYDCWLRNIAVGLGNAPYSLLIVKALQDKLQYPNPMVQEHVKWALIQQLNK